MSAQSRRGEMKLLDGYREPVDRMARKQMKKRGVWSQYCHWAHIWLMMPEVAYRLASCLTVAIPDENGRGSLLGQCYVEAAQVIKRWPSSDSTVTLVGDAMRVMLTRASEASRHVVMVGQHEWNPRLDGPLAPFLHVHADAHVTVYPRETGLAEAAADLHALLSEHVFCGRCELNLRSNYGQLLGLQGEA